MAGDYYQIQWTRLTAQRLAPGSRHVIQEPILLPPAQQREIDALFSNPPAGARGKIVKPAFQQGPRLTDDEALELWAIRAASALFEQYTPLCQDLAKGFDSNITGTALDSVQLNCANETETMRQFVVTLARRGLLKHFEIHGETERAYLVFGEHSALVLVNRRTAEEFVVDSWFEAGGQPAHILTKADWLARRENENVVEIAP